MKANDFKDLRALMNHSDSDSSPVTSVHKSGGEEASTRTGDILLQREIKVQCWRVIGQVARASKREELISVLLRSQERGSTDAADIAGHLLFEMDSRRPVAQRLLDIAVSFGLLAERDRRYELTEAGIRAIETEQVFVPEQGTWTLWVSTDPLLPGTLLQVEAWHEPPAHDEVWGRNKDDVEQRQKRFSSVPDWVLPKKVSPRPVLLPGKGGSVSRVEHLEPEGEVVDVDVDVSLRVVWEVSRGSLRLRGTLNGFSVDRVIDAPVFSTEQVWRQLLEAERLWPKWDQTNQALLLGFEETTDEEREPMLRDIQFDRPRVKGCDVFEPMTVKDIALRARSAKDAQHWAQWRLQQRIQNYATSTRFSNWEKEAVAPFDEFKLSTSGRHELAQVAWQRGKDRPSPAVWYLVAAEDWSL